MGTSLANSCSKGARPAVLAAGGARVLLLEKARSPRYKPCGGGITERARQVSPLVRSFPPETSALKVFVSFGGRTATCPLPAPIGLVMRDRFDAYLTEQAALARAEVRDGSGCSGGLSHQSSWTTAAHAANAFGDNEGR